MAGQSQPVATLPALDVPAKPRVLIICRSDGESKQGGDVSLLRSFGRELASEFEVDTFFGVPSVERIASYDAVISANLDRPVEPAATLKRAAKAGRPFVLYSLHHPYAGIAPYLRNGTTGLRSLIARAARYSPQRYEQLLWSIHMVVDSVGQRRLPNFGSVASSQELLLSKATRVVVCSEDEAATIDSEVGSLPTYEVVAHPADQRNGSWRPVPGRVIVPGRIESRKNQMMATRLAPFFPDCEFVFIGAALESDRRYVADVLAAVEAEPNCRYVESLPQEEFYEYLNTAQAVFSASWFEVTSLVELHCARLGIPLAVTQHSYLPPGDRVFPLSPGSLTKAAAALQACLELPVEPFELATEDHEGSTMADVIKAAM